MRQGRLVSRFHSEFKDRPSEEARARAQFLLLAALTVALDPGELDEILTDGRALADSAIASVR